MTNVGNFSGLHSGSLGDEVEKLHPINPKLWVLPLATVYSRGLMKGFISLHYKYYPTFTKWG